MNDTEGQALRAAMTHPPGRDRQQAIDRALVAAGWRAVAEDLAARIRPDRPIRSAWYGLWAKYAAIMADAAALTPVRCNRGRPRDDAV